MWELLFALRVFLNLLVKRFNQICWVQASLNGFWKAVKCKDIWVLKQRFRHFRIGCLPFWIENIECFLSVLCAFSAIDSLKVTPDFCPVCHTHFVGNRSGKVHKACLVLDVWINAKNTVVHALQAIRNKQKNFFCTTFFQVKKQLFSDKGRLDWRDGAREYFFWAVLLNADSQVARLFRYGFKLEGNIGRIQIHADISRALRGRRISASNCPVITLAILETVCGV